MTEPRRNAHVTADDDPVSSHRVDGSEDGLTIALVGVGAFGFMFAPMYLHHPDVRRVILCDRDEARLVLVASAFGIKETTTDFEAILASPVVDAVHLVTPMHLHAPQAVAALDAGKHCACAVPMGLTFEELRAVVAAERRAGKNYMMMETAVYTQEYFQVKELLDLGEIGRIQLLRGAHHSDYERWPEWKWYPPMYYSTHAVAPLLALTGTRMKNVRCLGSGTMPDQLRGPSDNPYPVETAIFELDQSNVIAEVTRSIFRTARRMQEAFYVYGERASFEWQQLDGEEPVLFRVDHAASSADSSSSVVSEEMIIQMSEDLGVSPSTLAELLPMTRFPPVHVSRLRPNTRCCELLPEAIRGFRVGHGGSEAHLVHEFVRSIVEGRSSPVSAVVAAEWTAPGICAHESALQGGTIIDIPSFRDGRV